MGGNGVLTSLIGKQLDALNLTGAPLLGGNADLTTLVVAIIGFIIYVLIIMFLWNRVAVPLSRGRLSPIRFWQAVGLKLLINVLFSGINLL